MSKLFEGKVVSTKMNQTAVVEVVRKTPHPLYKKLLKRTKRFKVDTAAVQVAVLDVVQFVETKPISKEKTFKVVKVVTPKNGKKEEK